MRSETRRILLSGEIIKPTFRSGRGLRRGEVKFNCGGAQGGKRKRGARANRCMEGSSQVTFSATAGSTTPRPMRRASCVPYQNSSSWLLMPAPPAGEAASCQSVSSSESLRTASDCAFGALLEISTTLDVGHKDFFGTS